jgi:2-C-methyl-D-erythritol 4-phosphate cytidylyltransferase
VDEFARLVGPRALVVAGGETRSASVRLGFEALAARDDDFVSVHDAARPLVTAEEAREVLEAAEKTGAAIAAVPVVDTVKRVADGRILSTLDRAGLFGAATPQVFQAAILRRALGTGREATDEAALCEELGIPVAVVPVSRLSFKITVPADLELAEAILASRRKRAS